MRYFGINQRECHICKKDLDSTSKIEAETKEGKRVWLCLVHGRKLLELKGEQEHAKT